MIRVRQSRDGSVAVDTLDEVLFEVGDSGDPKLAELLREQARCEAEEDERWRRLDAGDEFGLARESLEGWVPSERLDDVTRMLLEVWNYEPSSGYIEGFLANYGGFCGAPSPCLEYIERRGWQSADLALLLEHPHDVDDADGLRCLWCRLEDENTIANVDGWIESFVRTNPDHDVSSTVAEMVQWRERAARRQLLRAEPSS